MTRASGRPLALLVVAGVAALLLVTVVSAPAAATARNASVTPESVVSTATITVNATADAAGNDLTFAVDGDADGTIQADEAFGTATSNGITGNGSVSGNLSAYVSGEGTFTIYVVEESSADGSDDTTYPVADPGAFYDANVTVEVDETAPTITNVSVTNPEGRDVRVTFNSTEPLADARIAVDGPDDGELTEVDLVASGTGPYAYEATYFPAVDGEYGVRLATAEDAAGNDGAGGENATVVAAVDSRDATTVFSTPGTLFLGETGVDVSPALGDGPVTFSPVGDSDGGRPVSVNASSVDATAASGFEPGGYDATGDGTVDVIVRRPTIDDVSLVLADGPDDVEVSGAYLQAGDAVTLTATFGFGAVDELDVSVVDPFGVDVAPALTDATVLHARDDGVRLDTGRLDLETGTYTVEVTSDRFDATASARFTLVDREPSVSLDRTRVVRDRAVTATAFGAPGGRVVVRLPAGALANDSTAASDVFEETGDVENVTRGSGFVAVELALGRDGIAQTRFDTAPLEARPSTVSVVEGTIAAVGTSSADDVPLEVDRKRVVLREAPEAASINEAVVVTGSAPGSATVKAYARVGDAWHPVRGDDWARADVAANGSFELVLPVEGELSYPGSYQVAVVGLPEPSATALQSNETLTHESLSARPFETFTLETSLGG